MSNAAVVSRSNVAFAPVSGFGAAWRVLRNLSNGSHATWPSLPLHAMGERTIDVHCADNTSLTVRVVGAGRPFVLVHGLGGSHKDWSAAAALLARKACVYRFDQRGHRGRKVTYTETGLIQMASDLKMVIEQLGLVQPILVGHSLGALTVMQYLHDYGSGNVAGVCFVDQSPRITTDTGWSLGLFGSVTQTQLQNVIERLRDSFYDTVIDEIVLPTFPVLAAACRQQRWLRGLFLHALSKVSVSSLINVLQSLKECDFRDLVQCLGIPAMVVLGGRSTHYGGLLLGDYYGSALGIDAVKIYSMAGHSPHRQEPARFVADLLTFATSLHPEMLDG